MMLVVIATGTWLGALLLFRIGAPARFIQLVRHAIINGREEIEQPLRFGFHLFKKWLIFTFGQDGFLQPFQFFLGALAGGAQVFSPAEVSGKLDIAWLAFTLSSRSGLRSGRGSGGNFLQ